MSIDIEHQTKGYGHGASVGTAQSPLIASLASAFSTLTLGRAGEDPSCEIWMRDAPPISFHPPSFSPNIGLVANKHDSGPELESARFPKEKALHGQSRRRVY